MPAQPAWVQRLDETLADLQPMTSTHLDRRAVEKLFRVRQRRAPGGVRTRCGMAPFTAHQNPTLRVVAWCP